MPGRVFKDIQYNVCLQMCTTSVHVRWMCFILTIAVVKHWFMCFVTCSSIEVVEKNAGYCECCAVHYEELEMMSPHLFVRHNLPIFF